MNIINMKTKNSEKNEVRRKKVAKSFGGRRKSRTVG